MLTDISIENFRSIETAKLTFSPITVFYGPTASGKSTALYAILALRNFVLTPNRQADGFLHLGFMDLGGYDACVFNHESSRSIKVSLSHNTGNEQYSYGLSFSKTAADIQQRYASFVMEAKVSIPYGLNQSFSFEYADGDEEFSVNWNGITSSVTPKNPTADSQQKAQEIAARLNTSSEVLKGIDIAPHKRGFFKPMYQPASVSPTPTTEDEVASIIINDPNLAPRISSYSDEIFERDFRLHMLPGTATAYLQTMTRKSRIPVYLVNDGFGVNQVIYILAKILRVDVNTLLIEEPEVHLHPTIIRNFSRTLCSLVKEENKQVILTTHSELFLAALLTAVSDDIISPSDIKCYLTMKEKRTTSFTEQAVHENGQVEGGLSSFIEAEYEDIKKFLGTKAEK
jgi:predicted ATPase